VALADDDKIILSKEINEPNSHAAHLTKLISDVLSDSGFELRKVNAIGLNGGPGSYTGLRVGVSVAKGLCYSLSIPLIAVDGLKCLAFAAIQKHRSKYLTYCAVMNSRRDELYCSLYRSDNLCILKSEAVILDAALIQRLPLQKPVCIIGSGAEKFRSLVSNDNDLHIDNEVIMSASHLSGEIFLKYKNDVFESVTDFEPFYLKPVHIRKKLE
jgi:tRNA threonylcarbamoyladenosine biosynthesis protein TsaB